MSISENIAKYRKQKGYTQEQLGELLGVTNQAVSKWESAVSMPDVLLLPRIADVLGITLNDLYGITAAEEPRLREERIDHFASDTQKFIRNYLFKHLFEDTECLRYIVKFEQDSERNAHIYSGYNLGILPYTAGGAAFVSENLSIISSDFRIEEGGKLLESIEIASAMKKLCDTEVRKVLGYLYLQAFATTKPENIFEYPFTIRDISAACGMEDTVALKTVEDLAALHIVEINREDRSTQYIFQKTRAIETAVTFLAVESLIRGEMHFGCGYIVGHGTLG